MNNSEYWEKRALLIENENFKNTEYHLTKVKEQYEIAKYNIQKEIDKFYENFAINNQVKLADAKKILNNDELKEFKIGLKQYEKMVETDNEELLQQINNISIKHRISRFQALQHKINFILEELNDNNIKEVDKNFFENAENTYYKNIYYIEKNWDKHSDFTLFNSKIANDILTYNWSGVTYSERIWRNQEKLKQQLTDVLNKNFIQGNSINELAAEMSKMLDTDYKNCTRLIRTEANFISNKSAIEAYKERNVKQYQFTAVLDLRTSEMCSEMDGKIINIDDMVVGVNCPPLHPNCRSTVIPYIEGLERNRVARNPETGEVEEVGNLTYKEWYSKYVTKNLPYKDITNETLKNAKKQYMIMEQPFFIDDNGIKYKVDGKYVIMKPTENEKQVANLLGELYGGKVKIIPRINLPENIKTPDYMIGNKKYDLKEIKGNGKYVIQGNLKGKSQQADNFVIDISKSKIQEIDAIEQIKSIYKSKHYLWIDELILIKDNQILKMYKRK